MFPSRKIVHISMLLFAFLLPFMSWKEAAGCALMALAFNVFILPRLEVDLRKRPSEPSSSGPLKGSEAKTWTGIVIYPISVLLLILIYRHDVHIVAGVWAIMALGDGLASVAGEALGGAGLPWNNEKTWAGFFAFIAAGTIGAYTMTRWVAPELDADKALTVCLVTSMVGAAVESLPIRLDDNFSVPLVCGAFMYCAYMVDRSALAGNLPHLRVRIVLAVAVNLVFSMLALALKWADRSGAAMGFLLGVAIYLGDGYKSFLILLAFILLGSLATKVGYARKRALGVAERRGGARNWRQALANCLPAAFFAVLAISTFFQTPFFLALLAALAEAAGDTVSSEIGEWISGRTYLITTLAEVPCGEDGGVSLGGSAAGLGSAIIVVGIGATLGLCGRRPASGAAIALGAAVAGNVLDSLLGATLERRGLLTNGAVNFAGTAFAGAIALVLALKMGLN